MKYKSTKKYLWVWRRITYTVIILNAIIYGVMTLPNITTEERLLLDCIDGVCLLYFIIELVIKIYHRRMNFFKNGWNVFDFSIVMSSVIFAMSAISVLRAFRVIRLLKVLSTFSRLRIILTTLLEILPSMGWISGLLFVVYYVYAVLGNQLFGKDYPEFFGDLGSSMFTLFQVMTLDAWSEQIARQMLSYYPLSWLYYLSFIIITAVIVLNIVVGIVVESVNRVSRMEKMRKKKINNDLKQDVSAELEQIRIHLESIEQRLMRK